jgi:hypothetical protein
MGGGRSRGRAIRSSPWAMLGAAIVCGDCEIAMVEVLPDD